MNFRPDGKPGVLIDQYSELLDIGRGIQCALDAFPDGARLYLNNGMGGVAAAADGLAEVARRSMVDVSIAIPLNSLQVYLASTAIGMLAQGIPDFLELTHLYEMRNDLQAYDYLSNGMQPPTQQ